MSEPETDPDAGRRDRGSRGPIIIARHGKPSLDRRAGPRLSWREYQTWWENYEKAGLADGQTAPDALKALIHDSDVFLASVRPRAIETARSAAPHVTAELDPVFVEAPLPPPRWGWAKFLPKTWNVFARGAWMFGHALDGESLTEARSRASRAADVLHDRAREGKVFLAAHGWFNRMLRPELKKRGWTCTHDGGDHYWAYRVYEYRP